MRVALVTIVSGRHAHFTAQREGIRAGEVLPDDHVVVSMGDPLIRGLVAGEHDVTMVELDVGPAATTAPMSGGHLPLARARNRGAEVALARGAELLIFLDVDCIPGPGLIWRYLDAVQLHAHSDALLCGPVTYLPPPPYGGYPIGALHTLADPHPARPVPPTGAVVAGGDYDLFWSLSFALSSRSWRAIGGFSERYEGYGGEDTDFAWTARDRGVGLSWVGGADAFHQYHPVSNPPVEHLDDILRNAATFQRRWGVWPMPGWLAAFEAQGLIEFDAEVGWVRRR
ncbi:MAG: putative sugar transferase [Pseudonocardiales bacterium]|nr:putative sugar transferase [Pseudonocardiales bacterium]